MRGAEKAWAKLKDTLRRGCTLSRDAFDYAVARTMDAIDHDDIGPWTAFAGYTVEST